MKKTALSTTIPIFVLGVLFASPFGQLKPATASAAPPGSAPVTIVNTPLPVTGNVTLVPSQPFAASGTGSTQDTLFAIDEFVVPAGKRLIVETVTLSARVPAGDFASCGVSVELAEGGVGATHNFVVTPQGPVPGLEEVFVSTSPVRLYYQPDDELNWFCFRNGLGAISFVWSISGYLIDV